MIFDFRKSDKESTTFQDRLEGLCLEKRAFYRAISGLHASITIHLCANHPTSSSSAAKGDSPFLRSSAGFAPNPEEFGRRFDPASTNGQGPFWLRNLYFVYLLELRALAKVAPLLEGREEFYTGDEDEDKETRVNISKRLL